jgi:BTB/POZ domain-containing protein KCTD9
MATRKNYEASCLRLQPDYLEPGNIPPVPDHMPQYDDEDPLGVNFFRMMLDADDLSSLSLPRTFFGRSEFTNVSFHNTDLSESNLCWNDFIGTDFSSALLVRSDLRASSFSNTSFNSADLSGADLRQSSFDGCDFFDARMLGAALTVAQGAKLSLSHQQRSEISWADNDGPEPGGG